jgi:hypothetical protein
MDRQIFMSMQPAGQLMLLTALLRAVVILQVLRNPSVPFQESKSVELSMLTARGVKPYGPPVDVWAAGVLAYELVCGRWVACLSHILLTRQTSSAQAARCCLTRAP